MNIESAGRTIGAIAGWGTAITLAAWDGLVPPGRVVPFMLISLSIALFCTVWMALERHSAPLGFAFDLGYSTGRKDAVRDATRRSSTVVPIRRMPNGLSAFNREKVGS
jgi:hypothetical protein